MIASSSHSVHCREVCRGLGSDLSVALAVARRNAKLAHFMMRSSTLRWIEVLEDYAMMVDRSMLPLYR